MDNMLKTRSAISVERKSIWSWEIERILSKRQRLSRLLELWRQILG